MSGPIEPEVLAEWTRAIGRSETREERCEMESLRRYALAVGADPGVEEVSPPLAHWAFFLPQPRDEELGPDGHPKRGAFLPDITLPRRMFAAADIVFEAPLVPEAEARMVATIADVTHKRGKSGDLVFVEVDRTISQGGAVCVRERQSYVYRDLGDPVPLPIPGKVQSGEVWKPDSVSLFRFSAATFNSHRIHYDLPYAIEAEGYPALVVHGPFTAAKLAGLAARKGALRRFAFRAQAPLFLGQPIYLEDNGSEVRALRCDGVTAMSAKVEYRV